MSHISTYKAWVQDGMGRSTYKNEHDDFVDGMGWHGMGRRVNKNEHEHFMNGMGWDGTKSV